MHVGDVDYLLAPALNNGSSTGSGQSPVQDAAVTIPSLRSSERKVAIERVRQGLGVKTLERSDQTARETVVEAHRYLLILWKTEVGIDRSDVRARRRGCTWPRWPHSGRERRAR